MFSTTEFVATTISRQDQIVEIAGVTQQLVNVYGRDEFDPDAPRCGFRYLAIRDLEIGLLTPGSHANDGRGDYQSQLIIRDCSPGVSREAPAVLNVAWDPAQSWAEPFKIVQFRPGAWIGIILEMGVAFAPPSEQMH